MQNLSDPYWLVSNVFHLLPGYDSLGNYLIMKLWCTWFSSHSSNSLNSVHFISNTSGFPSDGLCCYTLYLLLDLVPSIVNRRQFNVYVSTSYPCVQDSYFAFLFEMPLQKICKSKHQQDWRVIFRLHQCFGYFSVLDTNYLQHSLDDNALHIFLTFCYSLCYGIFKTFH